MTRRMTLALAGMLLAILGIGVRRAMQAGAELARNADEGDYDALSHRLADWREETRDDLDVAFARADVMEARLTALERARDPLADA